MGGGKEEIVQCKCGSAAKGNVVGSVAVFNIVG